MTRKLQEKWNTYCSVDGTLRAHGEDRDHGACHYSEDVS